MIGKRTLLVRFYPETDADLIAWLEGLAAGQGNDNIKAKIRAGILATQSDNANSVRSTSSVLTAALDPESLQSALERILPRIREIVDASLASACIARIGSEPASQGNNQASADLLKGHLLGEDEVE